MIVGKKYRLHDSYGVDEVECIGINMSTDFYSVKIRYLLNGEEDFYIESKIAPPYVEEIES